MKPPRPLSPAKQAEADNLELERAAKREKIRALASLAAEALKKREAAKLEANAQAAVKRYPGAALLGSPAPKSEPIRPVKVAHKTVSAIRRGCVGIHCSTFLNDYKH